MLSALVGPRRSVVAATSVVLLTHSAAAIGAIAFTDGLPLCYLMLTAVVRWPALLGQRDLHMDAPLRTAPSADQAAAAAGVAGVSKQF